MTLFLTSIEQMHNKESIQLKGLIAIMNLLVRRFQAQIILWFKTKETSSATQGLTLNSGKRNLKKQLKTSKI